MGKHKSRMPKPPKEWAAVGGKPIRPSGYNGSQMIFHPDAFNEMKRRGWINEQGEWTIEPVYNQRDGVVPRI